MDILPSEWRVVKGFPVGPDGRVHTTFTHNPSTLRLSSAAPNLQNIPRGGGSEIARWVKDMFEAPPGFVFVERDFSAIEAVLVGYFAGSPRYTRFAKLGVHDYVTANMVREPITDLSVSDAELRAAFKLVKAKYPEQRDIAKRVVHGSNYLMTPRKMNEEFPEFFPTIKAAASLQSLYLDDLFPEIRDWHKRLTREVDGARRRAASIQDGEEVAPWDIGVAQVRNPFGYLHRFYHVLEWEKIEGEWVSSFGEDAKRLIAFLPQSTAAAIIKGAARNLWYKHPAVGQHMRLLIHDSILFEVPESDVDLVLKISKEVMEAPWAELPLDPTWGMGEFLSIGSEAKVGKVWSGMEGVRE